MTARRLRFPIGISDFRRVREEGYAYVDKTGLIEDVLAAGARLEAALRQIRERRYSAELRAAGAQPIREVGVVFDGKRAWARFQESEPAA